MTLALEVPERFNAVIGVLDSWADESPDDVALLTVDESGEARSADSVADLARVSREAARALIGLGIGKGDRLLVMLPRGRAWYAAVLGAIRLGAIPMPASNQSTSRDIAYRIASADAVAAITDEVGAQRVDEIAHPIPSLRHRIMSSAEQQCRSAWFDLDELIAAAGDGETPRDPTAAADPMLIFFTSGTTSQPKMVLHDQSYAIGHIRTARVWHDLRRGDVHWTVSDSGWAKAAWGSLFGQWIEQATVFQAEMRRPSADAVLRILAQHPVTSFCAPPTLYRMLVQEDLSAYDFATLRHCTSSGEPLNPEVIRAWRVGTGLTIYDAYGQTESTVLVANHPAVPVRQGSMGRPVPGYDVSVLDEAGAPVPPGTVGEIAVRSNPHPVGLFHGYYRDSAATAHAFRDGWYYTGDRARIDPEGYFWFEGRSDDVITSAAYRIGPFEVESALVEHPAVTEAAVVGKPDAKRTQIVTAFVTLSAGFEPSDRLTAELQEHTRRVTAPYKYPREIHYVSELPKTVSGKISRQMLRERLIQHSHETHGQELVSRPS